MGDAAPLVSIIVPAYNAARFLPETIASVQAQTVADWELIVSDDGSTDSTAAVAREHSARDPRVRVLVNPPARHPGPPRNAALGVARGSHVAFLDADDLWLPAKLEAQLRALRGVAKPGIVYTLAWDFADGSDEAILQSHLAPLRSPPERQYAETLLFCLRACLSSFLMTREFAQEIGAFTTHPLLAGYEDWDYALRALYRRPMICVPEVLVRYRVHPASITRMKEGEWERFFEIYRQVEARGEMPSRLRGPCQSVAWLYRGECELRAGRRGWRRSLLRSLALDPLNWRRWPLAAALGLRAGMMRRYYDALKTLQTRWEGPSLTSSDPGRSGAESTGAASVDKGGSR